MSSETINKIKFTPVVTRQINSCNPSKNPVLSNALEFKDKETRGVYFDILASAVSGIDNNTPVDQSGVISVDVGITCCLVFEARITNSIRTALPKINRVLSEQNLPSIPDFLDPVATGDDLYFPKS